MARNSASQRARDEIARTVEVKVQSMLKDFMSESGIGDESEAIEYSESVSKQIANTTLSGSKIVDSYKDTDGTWILVEFPLSAAKDALKKATKLGSDHALYNEFKAKQGFDSLDKAIDALDAD